MIATLPPLGLFLLVGGGFLYTAGVPFFRMGNRRLLWHALWHVFVLAASAMHYACVFFFVYPLPAAHPAGGAGGPNSGSGQTWGSGGLPAGGKAPIGAIAGGGGSRSGGGGSSGGWGA